MSINRGSKVAAIAGGLALLALTIPGAVAHSEPAPVFAPDAIGVLKLQLDASVKEFRFEPVPDWPGELLPQQPVTGGCPTDPSPQTGSLVALTPTGGKLGLNDDGLGVRTSGEGGGQKCGQVNGTNQRLSLTLAGGLADKEIDFADLDIEGKFGVKVRAELRLDGSTVGSDTLDTTTAGSDSGPDDRERDNFRWVLDAPGGAVFDEVVLSVDASTPGGAFSLEGGADTGSESSFHLVDISGVLDCGDTVTAEGSTSATLVRGENLDCTKIPYVLRTGDQTVDLLKDVGNQTGANFTLQIAWEPEPVLFPPAPTRVDFGSGEVAVEPCGTTSAPWCLAHQEIEYLGATMELTETYRGTGDPSWSR